MTNRHDDQELIRRGIGLLVDQAPIAPDFDEITTQTVQPLPSSRSRSPLLMFIAGILVVGALVVVAAVLSPHNGPLPQTMSDAAEDSSCPGGSRQPGTMGGPDEIVDQLRYVPTIDIPLLEHLTGWSVDYGSWCHPTPTVAMIRWEDPRLAAAGIVVWEDIDQPDPEQLGNPAGEGLWSSVSYEVSRQLMITVNGQNDGRWFRVVGRGDLDDATVIEAAGRYRASGDLQLDQQVWEDVTQPASSDPVPAVVWYLDARNSGDVFTASVMLRPDFNPKATAAEGVFGCELVEVPIASGTTTGVLCNGAIIWETSPGVVADTSGNTLDPNQIIATAGSMTLISETDPTLPPPPSGDQ